MLALTLFANEALAIVVPVFFGQNAYFGALPGWMVTFFILHSLIYGTWLDRFRLSLGYRAIRSFVSPLSATELWSKMIMWLGAAYDDPLLRSIEPDAADANSFEVTYACGHSVFEHQSITYLEIEAPHRARYYFQGEANPRNASLTEGTYGVSFAEVPKGGTKVTLEEDRPAMLPRLALQMWLDYRLGDQADMLRALHRKKRDWSMAGRYRREVAAIG